MIATALPFVAGTDKVSSVMVKSIKTLYDTGKSINDFIDDHIEKMKLSENPTVSRTGSVLEGAKYGFGIGYITPVVVIAAGQLILGNTLAVFSTVATAATLTNPIAMTCAAVGAIYYGWNALSDQEKNEILEKLSHGLEIGIQMIKSVIRFVIDKTKELLSSENLAEIKKYISSAASVFGNTLGDVTHKIRDMVMDTFDIFKKRTVETIEKTGDVLSETYDTIKLEGEKVIENMRSNKGKTDEKNKQEPFMSVESIPVAEMKMKLTSKGQLTIPREVRQKLGLLPHSEVELVIEGNNIMLRKADS